ncbi:MAG: hypothetical protein U9N14_07920 [Pseudomonadota bacterium]|nr:hypothetical protein [Pseudomonadota bacterium]
MFNPPARLDNPVPVGLFIIVNDVQRQRHELTKRLNHLETELSPDLLDDVDLRQLEGKDKDGERERAKRLLDPDYDLAKQSIVNITIEMKILDVLGNIDEGTKMAKRWKMEDQLEKLKAKADKLGEHIPEEKINARIERMVRERNDDLTYIRQTNDECDSLRYSLKDWTCHLHDLMTLERAGVKKLALSKSESSEKMLDDAINLAMDESEDQRNTPSDTPEKLYLRLVCAAKQWQDWWKTEQDIANAACKDMGILFEALTETGAGKDYGYNRSATLMTQARQMAEATRSKAAFPAPPRKNWGPNFKGPEM